MKYIVIGIVAGVFAFAAYNFRPQEKSHGVYAKSLPAIVNIPNESKKAYYGDLHLHTTQSFDAYMFGTRIGPEEAYKYAKGESISYLGHQIKRNFPLDFLAVTDHSENIGVLSQLNDTTSLLYRSELGKKVRNNETYTAFRQYFFLGDYSSIVPGFDNKAVTRSAWQRQIDAANNSYEPGRFTSFIAYEWTSAPDRQNLHRNVIFRDAKATDRPFSSIDSKNPEDLWKFLENLRQQGTEALAIPHNGNASNGIMFDWNDSYGKPIDQNYALRRSLNEPLTEVSQNKGQTETNPILSPNDEFANFEVVDFMSPAIDSIRKSPGSYVRDAYGRGLEIKQKVGANPYKFGLVGASDLHGGISTSEEGAYVGVLGETKVDPQAALSYKRGLPMQTLYYGSGNITGVWSESNTRESIYDAFRRKETFGTSGTRLQFRFFGGWNYSKNIFTDTDWIGKAYKEGVSMGGELPAKPGQAKAPSFVVWSIKDPASGNLDRAQVIKVWLKGGKHYEKVFDVAVSNNRKADAKTGKIPPVGNTVDLKTATYKNTIGQTELNIVWTDPEFDATAPALYYLRVLEIPTPRWSTILAVKNNLALPSEVSPTIQERGWSSPIWYSPQP